MCLANKVIAAGGIFALHRPHNWRDGVSDHQPHDCLLNYLLRRRSTKTSKLRVLVTFVRGIHQSPVNSPYTVPVTWEIFPFDDDIMRITRA